MILDLRQLLSECQYSLTKSIQYVNADFTLLSRKGIEWWQVVKDPQELILFTCPRGGEGNDYSGAVALGMKLNGSTFQSLLVSAIKIHYRISIVLIHG